MSLNPQLFLGIDHPAIAANDVEKLANWYCSVLGYTKLYRHEKPVWILEAPDHTLLEIMPEDHTDRPRRTIWTPGWSHLAIRVASMEQAIERLDEQQVSWGGEIMPAIGGGRVRNLYDPEGNLLQLLERDTHFITQRGQRHESSHLQGE
ncbi:VOC family protein [Compostibacter hankyongensis]|uniref:VOC domain-containing protein n=1 Tax=Compostibacter hankyongensis TaxID=1007089 RepID=A0ABP8FF84_9BACT